MCWDSMSTHGGFPCPTGFSGGVKTVAFLAPPSVLGGLSGGKRRAGTVLFSSSYITCSGIYKALFFCLSWEKKKDTFHKAETEITGPNVGLCILPVFFNGSQTEQFASIYKNYKSRCQQEKKGGKQTNEQICSL